MRTEDQVVPSDLPRALVVVSHPDDASLNHAIASAAMAVLRDLGYHTDLCDLYRDGFNPLVTKAELTGGGVRDELVERYVASLRSADVLVVVHPNWWGAPPAMMKGWMDRVFAAGAAYSFEKGVDQGDVPRGLLQARLAIVFNTSNTEEERERSQFGDPLERIWRDCLLQYCGVQQTIRHVFRIVSTSTPGEREAWLRQVRRVVAEGVASGTTPRPRRYE